MLPSELTIEVRDRSLDRVGLIQPQFWSDVLLVPRLRDAGEWSMSLPMEHPLTTTLRTPGSGILVTRRDGSTLFSGPMTSSTVQQTTKDPKGTVKFDGVDDTVLLSDSIAYPDPARPAGSQRYAYDDRQGPGESVIRAYVSANLGPGALAERRGALASKLTLQPDQGRGTEVSGRARNEPLVELADTLGKLSGVAYRIAQVGDELVLDFWEPEDKSKLIRLDIANGRLSAANSSVFAPTVTHAVVMGQGEGAERAFVERANTDSVRAASDWGRRIEVTKDQRNAEDLNDLAQAGDELLVDGGKTRFETKITPSDDGPMQYGKSWRVGDVVSVVIGDTETPEVITSAAISITKDGVRIAAKVGEQ